MGEAYEQLCSMPYEPAAIKPAGQDLPKAEVLAWMKANATSYFLENGHAAPTDRKDHATVMAAATLDDLIQGPGGMLFLLWYASDHGAGPVLSGILNRLKELKFSDDAYREARADVLSMT